MKVQIYVINRTYIAEDLSTGLVAYGDSAEEAQRKLTMLVTDYWEKKKVIVPINKETSSNHKYTNDTNDSTNTNTPINPNLHP